MFEGHIIAPRQVESELAKWDTKIGPMKAWLRGHHHIFRDVETNAQLEIAKRIVNAYPAYGESQNYLGDLEVITLAAARGITVISLEVSNPNPSKRRPKIPDVCAEFNVGCLSLPGFLRRESFGKTAG